MDYVIIVAGGKGMRMGTELPKQFLPVAGKPVLMRTIERFCQFSRDLNFIVVLPQSQQAYWHSHSFCIVKERPFPYSQRCTRPGCHTRWRATVRIGRCHQPMFQRGTSQRYGCSGDTCYRYPPTSQYRNGRNFHGKPLTFPGGTNATGV